MDSCRLHFYHYFLNFFIHLGMGMCVPHECKSQWTICSQFSPTIMWALRDPTQAIQHVYRLSPLVSVFNLTHAVKRNHYFMDFFTPNCKVL